LFNTAVNFTGIPFFSTILSFFSILSYEALNEDFDLLSDGGSILKLMARGLNFANFSKNASLYKLDEKEKLTPILFRNERKGEISLIAQRGSPPVIRTSLMLTLFVRIWRLLMVGFISASNISLLGELQVKQYSHELGQCWVTSQVRRYPSFGIERKQQSANDKGGTLVAPFIMKLNSP